MPSCTNMLVVISLEHGVSTLLAEVVRLKQVVNMVRPAADERTVCYLLHGVLQGTNSAECQTACGQWFALCLPDTPLAPSQRTTSRWRTYRGSAEAPSY
jgi:hypothetical protein